MTNDRHDRGNFTWKDPRAFIGALLIVLFGAFVSFLSLRADAWDQYLSLYTGVTAVMTGVLGAILGAVLTNSRVQDAKTEMNHAIIERQETQGKLETHLQHARRRPGDHGQSRVGAARDGCASARP